MKSFSLKLLFVLFIISLSSTTMLIAQEESSYRTVGLSASLQGSQIDLLLPIFISKKVSFAPAFGITSIQDGGTEMRVGMATRIFFNKEELAPYLGGKFGIISFSPTDGSNLTDFVVGLSGGGEYYFSQSFSVGIEGQLNLGISDEHSTRFGTYGGKALTTGTAIYATVYF